MRAFFLYVSCNYLLKKYNEIISNYKYNIHIYTNVSIPHKTWILLEDATYEK